VLEQNGYDTGQHSAFDMSTFTMLEDKLPIDNSTSIEYQYGTSQDGSTITWSGSWQTAAAIVAAAATVYGRYFHLKERVNSAGTSPGSLADHPTMVQYSEATPARLFRSVGITATDLNTDTRTMEISGNHVVFNGAMPDKVGVGDVLQYDITGTKYLAFIHERLTSTVYRVQDKDGGDPQVATAGQAVSVFRAYISLFNWEAMTENTNIDAAVRDFDTSANLAVNNKQMKVACYADGADTTGVRIDSWTTNESCDIEVFTPYKTGHVGTSQRHVGYWSDSIGYRLDVASGIALDLREDYITIKGLQISSGDSNPLNSEAVDTGMRYIRENIIKGNAVANKHGIYAHSSGGIVKIQGNVVYDVAGTDAYGINIRNAGLTAYVDMNTLVDGMGGIWAREGTVVARCNLLKGHNETYNYHGTFAEGTDFNKTDVDDDPGVGSHNIKEATITFKNEAGDDFHLAAATGDGKDLSGDANAPYNSDIDGEERSGAIDIGADQYVAPPADYPAVGDVEAGVTYDSGDLTGTFAVPAAGKVRNGEGYGEDGTEFTGTSVAPSENDVESGVGYGAGGSEFTGNKTICPVGKAIEGQQYGAGGTEHTGTYHETAENEVKKDIQFGAGGTEKTGSLESTDPGEANVLAPVSYKIESVEKTGLFDEAARNSDPGEGNVIKDVAYEIQNVPKTGTFDEAARNSDPGILNVIKDVAYKILNVAKVGTFDETARNTDPGEANVKDGTDYKILNVDKEGTYAVDAPDTPLLAVVDNGDGSGATFTMTGASAGSTNTLKTWQYGGTEWTSQGAIVNSTPLDKSLATGNYIAIVESVLGGGSSISLPVNFIVTDSSDAEVIKMADAVVSELNEGAFTQEFTAERVYMEIKELADIETAVVLVAPMGRVETVPAAHIYDKNKYRIDITVLKKLASDVVADVDALIKLTDEIYRHFRLLIHEGLNHIGENFYCEGVENDPLFDQEALKADQTYKGVVSLIFGAVT